MKISEYISKDIKALTLNNTIGEAKILFDALTFSHLPIAKDGMFLGAILESDVRTVYDNDLKIIDYKDILNHFYVKTSDNWMDILKQFSSNETNILPVLTSDNLYAGYYELTDVLHFFNDTPLLNHEGFFLVIEKNNKDYSFSEIAQIIESNEAKLIGMFVSGYKDDMVIITLKIASEEINDIIQSFRRYGYNLLTKHKEDLLLEELKERSEYLQKYLNI